MRFAVVRLAARRLSLGALFAALLLLPAAVRAQNFYNVTDIGALAGGQSKGYAINNRGHVVGVSLVNTTGPDEWHPFFWSNGTLIDIGTFGGSDGDALALNESDYVVGTASTTVGALHPYVWSNIFLKRDIGSLSPSGQFGAAHDINGANQVVGQSELSFLNDRAYLWTATTGMVALGTLGGNYSVARGINEAGEVVGDAQTAAGLTHAFIYRGGPLIDLNTLGGNFSRAHDLNDNGTVVGYSTLSAGGVSPPYHGFIYTTEGGMVDMGSLGGNFSEAFEINNLGEAVGYGEVPGGAQHAFVYTGGAMYDLNDLITPGSGWILKQARGINDKGVIVGYGTLNGVTRAFLLTPQVDEVPPPAPPPCAIIPPSGPLDSRQTPTGRLGAPQPVTIFSTRP